STSSCSARSRTTRRSSKRCASKFLSPNTPRARLRAAPSDSSPSTSSVPRTARATGRRAPSGTRSQTTESKTPSKPAMLQHHTAAPQTALRPVARRRGYAPLTEDERNSLIEAPLPQVRYIAERMAAKLPPSVDRDDLIGAGVLGLIDAVGKFDPTRGVLFKTYAERRVRGAILDSLRDLDWVPQSVRRRAK